MGKRATGLAVVVVAGLGVACLNTVEGGGTPDGGVQGQVRPCQLLPVATVTQLVQPALGNTLALAEATPVDAEERLCVLQDVTDPRIQVLLDDDAFADTTQATEAYQERRQAARDILDGGVQTEEVEDLGNEAFLLQTDTAQDVNETRLVVRSLDRLLTVQVQSPGVGAQAQREEAVRAVAVEVLSTVYGRP